MPLREAFFLALEAIRTSKLRSFFTLLGIIVSVGFLVAVVAIIQGMNSYVRDNLRGAMIGTNSFQVRRSPIAMGNLDDSTVREINKRPIISQEDALVVREALADAEAVSLQSGWPTPLDRKSTRLNSSHLVNSYAVFCLKKKKQLVFLVKHKEKPVLFQISHSLLL